MRGSTSPCPGVPPITARCARRARASRSRPVRPARTTSGSKARRRRFRATCRRSRVCASCPRARRRAPSSSSPSREFGLVTGEAVEFRFFASAVRAGDRVGTLVADARKTLDELPGLSVTLPPLAGGTGQVVQVTLHPRVTEVGTLELWLHHKQSEQAVEARLQSARRRVARVERNQAVLRRDQGLSGPGFAARNPGRGSGCVAGSCVAPGSRG